MQKEPSVRSRVVVASTLALLLALLAGVGAPSEFVTRDSRWWTLDPLMFPALFAGIVLACIALIAGCIGSAFRAAAWLCLLASLSTAAGTVIAGGISDRRAPGFYVVCVALIGIPALVAVGILTRAGRT